MLCGKSDREKDHIRSLLTKTSQLRPHIRGQPPIPCAGFCEAGPLRFAKSFWHSQSPTMVEEANRH